MQKAALTWLMWKLTGKGVYVGLSVFAEQLPIFFFVPLAGVMADRLPRKKILLWTQSLLMVQAGLLAALAYTGAIQPWHIVVLSAWLGTIRSLDVPARQALVKDLVEDMNDLPNAIALGSMSFNLARIVGPGMAMLLVAYAGEHGSKDMPLTRPDSVCFAANAISFLAVLWSIWLIQVNEGHHKRKTLPVLKELKDGIAYAHSIKPIRTMLMMMAYMGFFGMTYQVILPVFTEKALHEGQKVYGYLLSSVGVGAICGAVFMASRKTVIGLNSRTVSAMALFGFSLAATATNTTAGMCMATLIMMGFGVMVFNSSTNTVLQTLTDDDKRGRVMSLYTLALNGTAPFGGLAAGYFVDKAGSRWTMLVCGGMVAIGAGAYFLQLPRLRQQVRPIYIAKGIIPEVASGIETAVESGVVEGKE
jgi:MFS family permease